jgi:hypothetical protein
MVTLKKLNENVAHFPLAQGLPKANVAGAKPALQFKLLAYAERAGVAVESRPFPRGNGAGGID